MPSYAEHGLSLSFMQPILEVLHLRKCFSKLEAVRDVSFQVQPGICFGLLGPNGAGKTTTLEIVEDIIEATGGESATMAVPARVLSGRKSVSSFSTPPCLVF